MSTIQTKLLRTAQQNKNELVHKLEQDKKAFRDICIADCVLNSSIYEKKCAELQAECDREVAILAEQLIFNLALNEPTTDDELGGGDTGADTGYIVDYSLPYLDRYQLVKAYYMTIEDPNERLTLYRADTVAMDYLGQYYTTLFNIFYKYTLE